MWSEYKYMVLQAINTSLAYLLWRLLYSKYTYVLFLLLLLLLLVVTVLFTHLLYYLSLSSIVTSLISIHLLLLLLFLVIPAVYSSITRILKYISSFCSVMALRILFSRTDWVGSKKHKRATIVPLHITIRRVSYFF